MNRRRFLTLVWLGALWASFARADDDDKEKKEREQKKEKDKKESENKKDSEKRKEEKKEKNEDEENRSARVRFYGQVLAADGDQVKVGFYTVEGAGLPWLAWAAPGMWVEVEGKSQGDRVYAESFRVLAPERFAYYQGPGWAVHLPQPFVEAWYRPGEKAPFALRVSKEGKEEALVVARADAHGYRTLPPGLNPPPPPGPGWFLLRGRWTGKGWSWEKPRGLPY